MYCSKCGKQIPDGAVFCPECGASQGGSAASYGNQFNQPGYSTSPPSMQKASYNTMCIVGLVVSCISLFLNFWGLVGIAGTILSVIGLTQCGKRNENGRALAVVGIALGVFSILFGVLSLMALAQLL